MSRLSPQTSRGSTKSSKTPGGSVEAEGLGDGPTHGKLAIAQLRLTLPPVAEDGDAPTVQDRVVQTAVLLILEPILEADFLDCSYGFRPNRNAHQALAETGRNLQQGRREVYDADLSRYFDTIPQDKLMACVQKRVSDRGGCVTIWADAASGDTRNRRT